MRIVFPITFGLAIVVQAVLLLLAHSEGSEKSILHPSFRDTGRESSCDTQFEVLQVHALQIVNFNSISHSVVVDPLINWQGRDKVGDEKNAVSTLPTLKAERAATFQGTSTVSIFTFHLSSNDKLIDIDVNGASCFSPSTEAYGTSC